MIAVQRAQLWPLSSPIPIRATMIPQISVIQPHVLRLKTIIWFGAMV